MVTGIEVAGLALGVFPLVIAGIKLYIDFAKEVKQMRDYEHTLDKFRRELKIEKSKFDNTWYTLASRAGVYIEPDMKPSPKITERVLSCLPEHAVESFIDCCQELNVIMGKLSKKFQEHEQDSAGYLKMLTMLRHFTTKDREEYVERIFRLNFNLDKLVNGVPPTATVQHQNVEVARHYQQVRKHAITLHSSLKENLVTSSCYCQTHSANLQLDVHYHSRNNHVPRVRLSLLFPVSADQGTTKEYSTLRKLEFQYLENPDLVESTPGEEYSKINRSLLSEYKRKKEREHKLRFYVGNPSPVGSISNNIYRKHLLREPSLKQFSPSHKLEFNSGNQGLVASTSHSKIPENPKFDVVEPSLERFSRYTIDQVPQSSAEYTVSQQKTEPPKNNLPTSSFGLNILRRLFQKKKEKVGFFPPAAELTHSSYVESSPVPSAPELIIGCFCSTIQSTKEIGTCVGILVGNGSKHRVWATREPLDMQTPAGVVSLAKLLSLPPPTRRERLKLAVKLASSVLQFHKTEWLQERWGKQDIYFIQEDPKSLEIPVVCQAFTPESSVPEASMKSIISCNLSLFSLGIVLIELWFWRSVESFQVNKPGANDPPEDLDTARFITATKLIQTLYGDAGSNYGDIVRRCINGLDHREIQLENDEFKNEVYLKVLQPLERDLEHFYSEPLEKIFKWSS